MNIAVIGGAGYLGSVLVRQLLGQGHRLRVIDNLTYGADSLSAVRHAIDLVTCDVGDVSCQDLADAEVVVNCAGLSNDPTADWNPELNWRENFTAVMHNASAAALAGVRHFLYASSCSTYDGVPCEQREPLTEDTDVQPLGHYSRAKFASERGLADLVESGMSVTAFRMGTLYGLSPRMRFDLVINRMARSAIVDHRVEVAGDGSQWRPVLSVRDAARAYALAASRPRPRGSRVLNLVGENLRVRDVAQAVLDAAVADAPHQPVAIERGPLPARVRSYRADGGLAEKVLGFRTNDTVSVTTHELLRHLRRWSVDELQDPRHENILWLTRDAVPA